MVVLCRNKMWELDMSFRLFSSLQKTDPDCEVEIIELTASMYKQKIKVPISELNDYSVVRNLNALSKN